jgi:hypothetical protein
VYEKKVLRRICGPTREKGAVGRTIYHRAEVDALIKESKQITVSEIGLTMGISYRSAFALIHDHLGYHKVCARRYHDI